MGNQIIAEFAEALRLSTANTTLCSRSVARRPEFVDIRNFPGVARAWVVFEGRAGLAENPLVVLKSYNVRNVTYRGTGSYTVVFSTSSIFTDNYITEGSVMSNTVTGAQNFYTRVAIVASRQVPLLSAININTTNLSGSPADAEKVSLLFFEA